MAIPQGYALASGWNAADGSLTLISELLRAYTVPSIGTTLTAKSGLVDTFPIRSLTLNGAARGDGMINATLTFAALPIAAYQYLLATYFSSGTVVSVPMTVVLAQYSISTIWQVWNCYMNLPQPFAQYTYDSQNVIGLSISLTDLILLR